MKKVGLIWILLENGPKMFINSYCMGTHKQVGIDAPSFG